MDCHPPANPFYLCGRRLTLVVEGHVPGTEFEVYSAFSATSDGKIIINQGRVLDAINAEKRGQTNQRPVF
jgi:hypothetical protein